MNTPYFNTYLYTVVGLKPNQMNNDIYKHLKNNLIRKMQGRCYKMYGFISKIYNIEDRQSGELVAEDPSASALYKVKFSCKLCRPLRGTTIVCEVEKINKSVILLRNGPIYVPIFEGRGQINAKKFVFDEKRNVWLAVLDDKKGIPITPGTFINIKVIDTQIEHNSKTIFVLGNMENLSSKEESDKSIREREDDNIQFFEHSEYIKNDKQKFKNSDDASSRSGEDHSLVEESESESSDSNTESESSDDTESESNSD